MTPIVKTEGLTHLYSPGTPFERIAVQNLDFQAMKGEFIGIIGHTGSGKSTLVNLLNGLYKPGEGRVLLDGEDIWDKPKEISKVRFRVGLVMQYPEYQLFADTVWEDIAYGPKNMGISGDELKERVEKSA